MSEPDEVVGPLFHAGVIELAAIAALRKWLKFYAAKACEQHDFTPGLAEIKSWAVVSEYDRFPEEGLPAVIVAAAGTDDTPVKDGAGFYHADYVLNVTVTCAADKGARARLMAELYNAAVRGAIGQRRSLGDELQITDWLGEGFGDVPTSKRRTQVAGGNAWRVHRKNIFTVMGGPKTAEPPGPSEWPEITSTRVDVEA